MSRYCLLALFFMFPMWLSAKKVMVSKDENPLASIQNDIRMLCSDRFGGRQVGTEGEMLAAEYIENRFKTLKIAPYKGRYQWDFSFKAGMRVGSSAFFKVFENNLVPGKDVMILPYGKGNTIKGFAMPRVYEPENVWLVPLSQVLSKSAANPQKEMYLYASSCVIKEASSVVFLNDMDITHDLSMLNLNSYDQVPIPVCFVNFASYQTYFKPNLKKDWIEVDAKLGYENNIANGRNVIASIDNNAPFSIIIAAHYDHLGYMGSLYKGADNNASGIAALLNIAEMVKANNLRRFNYIFAAFSGNEADLQGSKSFVLQNEFVLGNVSCMINLDMVGRLNNSRELYVNGIGTSPDWMPLLQKLNKGFVLHTDSSGVGYSDHNTFYFKNIPVLNISSGFHDDYMRTSDEERKINYQGIADIATYTFRMVWELDKQTKLIFNKTNDVLSALNKLKSDPGIVHDLTFNQNGLRVATTLPGSKAAIAGMLSGDVIHKIGMFNIIDFDDYMEAITKSANGKETTILVRRGKNEFKFFLVL